MDQLSSRIKQITSEIKEYLEARLDLMVINISEEITFWMGETIQKIIGFTVLGVGVFFAMIAAAIYLGEVLGHPALGYLVVSVPLILLGALFAAAKPKGLAKSIQNQFMNGILKSLEKKSSKEEELLLPKNTPQKLPSRKEGEHE